MLEGMDKKHSYDKFWLSEDMDSMGILFEWSDCIAQEHHGFTGVFDRLRLAEDFMNSRLRSVMERGHPGLLSESVEDLFERYVNVDCNGDLSRYRATEEPPKLHEYQMYWVGQAYAYIHYEADMPSCELIKKLPLKDMLHFYITGHQSTFENFYDRIKEVL